MYTFLTFLIVIACVMLVLVVLVQNPKGGGLGAAFGASSAQYFGVQRTTDFLEKATWVLAISMLVLTLVANVMIPTTTDVISTPNLDNAGQQQQPALPLDVPASSESNDALEDLLDNSSDSTSD